MTTRKHIPAPPCIICGAPEDNHDPGCMVIERRWAGIRMICLKCAHRFRVPLETDFSDEALEIWCPSCNSGEVEESRR
jgi:hypothetical protein